MPNFESYVQIRQTSLHYNNLNNIFRKDEICKFVEVTKDEI